MLKTLGFVRGGLLDSDALKSIPDALKWIYDALSLAGDALMSCKGKPT